MNNNVFQKYDDLDIGMNIAIRFFDGTIVKGKVSALQDDTISIIRVSASLPQKNSELKLSNLDLKVNTFDTLIYSIPNQEIRPN